ncbi:PhoX family protein [Prauserella halophila]|uniref:PhoX family protein n=1 Tax=Prauserella halophila TaxID=185641 RepID=UPI0020A41C19|nr:PhoX family phosphatase [Prauserella halophila]MCP2236721.1 hypothetical protein [Prauserella halophila]
MSAKPGRFLPLLTTHRTGRSPVTCEYRCGNQCSHPAPNTSGNEYFGDVVRDVVSRRGALRAGGVMAAAAAGFAALSGTAAAEVPALAAQPGRGNGNGRPGGHPGPGTDFDPVAPNTRDAVTVPEGYEQQVVIRWGDPVVADAPKFDVHNQTAAAQAKQFGYNNDFVGLIPQDGSGKRNFLVVNHEYTSETEMFPEGTYDEANPAEEQVRIGWAAHGLSVMQADRTRDGGLEVRHSRYNRRITLDTEFEVRGPVAGSELLTTSADPTGTIVHGTLNNCAGGVTPWGTVLSGEENFHQYFAHGDRITDPQQAERLDRYGLVAGESTRKWERFDERWDISREPNEVHRFGWVVEIDPNDPNAKPIKHTALGRFKHEAANIKIAADGRVVAYSGDDERFDYIYKFVSKGRYKPGRSAHARRHNMALLDEGTLYVAKFTGDSPASEIDGSGTLPSDGEFDGTGEWLALASGNESFVDGFTAEEVYVFTRLAADKVGATKMDRPEDIEPNPVTGSIYAALTNNSDRGAAGKAGADEPNPRDGNKNGHVLEWDEDGTETRFRWRLLLVCGDPAAADTYFGGFDKSRVSPISCPDNLAFDGYGNLWISTDGNELGSNDGLFSVPVTGPDRGQVKQFLTVPVGAETCGPVVRDDLVLVAVQHPGEGGEPGSSWPDGGHARPAIVAVRKSDGGRIGV